MTKKGIQHIIKSAMITQIVFATWISRANFPGWLVAFIILTAAKNMIQYDAMISTRGTMKARANMEAVYTRKS